MEQYDVVIIGAGPAGSTLARTIGPDLKVLLVDRRDFSLPLGEGHEKCCGGMLNLEAQKTLASFGLSLPKDVLVSPQVFTVRAIDFDAQDERYYQKQYVNIDRERFDLWLRSRALRSGNVTLADGCEATGFTQFKESVQVELRGKGGKRTVSCRYLVGADGAGSLIRRRLEQMEMAPDEPGGAYRTYVSIQQWFEAPEEYPYYAAFFNSRVTDYYSWMIPKGRQFILGSAIPACSDPKERFELLKDCVRLAGFPVDHPLRESGAQLVRPIGPGSVNLGRHRVFLMGEAAALISSSSEEGISYAMRSGYALGRSLLRYTSERPSYASTENLPAKIMDDYEKRVHGMKMKLIVKDLKAMVMYTPALRSAVFKSGLLSMKTVR